MERGDLKRVIICMPPRLGKSLTSSVRFPAWFMGRNPDRRVLLGSYGASLAYDFSRQCRNELRDFGPKVFGVGIADDSAAVDAWDLQGKRGGLCAAGVGGPFAGKGADLLLIDDPIKNAAEADSATYREKVKRWYQTDGRTRLAPSAAVILIQTRWHSDDLAGWLIDEGKRGTGEKFTLIEIPMIDEEGTPLWPEQYDEEACAAIRVAVGSRAWSALYQQRPSPAGGTIFNRAWWKRWRELPPVLDEVLLSVDCSFKDKETSDFVTIGTWARKGRSPAQSWWRTRRTAAR